MNVWGIDLRSRARKSAFGRARSFGVDARPLARALAGALALGCGPTVVPLALLALVARRGGESVAWRDGALFVLFLSLLPVLVVLVAHRRGRVRDLGVSRREERAPVVAAAAALAALGALVLRVEGAPAALAALAQAAATQSIVLAALTLREKVSYHAAGVAALAVAAWLLDGAALGLAVGALALATGWSRCYLGKHTPRQVALGLLSGLLVLPWLLPVTAR